MKGRGIFISSILAIINTLAIVFIGTATYEHGTYGFTHLTSVFITEFPKKYSFIDVFPILVCVAIITAAPILLFNRTRRGLLAFSLEVFFFTMMFCIAGERIPQKLDEYSIFSHNTVERSQLIRIYGAKIFYHRHGRSYAVEINPHHLARGQYISSTDQTYYFVQSALYQTQVSTNPNNNGGWRSDYCLHFTVEKAGQYERIVFPRHFIRSDELVSCPKDAV